MIEKTDSALVEAVLKGSHEAFTPLVLRHQNRVYATAVAVLSDFALDEDVAQDAFMHEFCRSAQTAGCAIFCSLG
jgi:DNA-directed RNA polymerase specialized sigma24 family protein